MTDKKRMPDEAPDTGDDAARDAEANGANERRKAAEEQLTPNMPPAALGAILDADPRPEEESETEKNLERGD